MYKALNYWVYGGFGPNKTPYEFIDFAKTRGLDGVELTLGDCLPVTISEAECRKIAAWLGAETILVVPGSTSVAWDPSRPKVAYGRYWEQATKSVRELLPLAERLGVNIALENVWMRFLLLPMEWKLFLDQFQSDRVGMYLDVGNCLIYLPAEDYVEILGSRVKAVHIKNWKGDDCGGGLHGFGDSLVAGDVDFAKLFAALEKVGYRGAFTAEMIPFSRLPDLVLPDAALAEKTAQELKRLLDR